MFRLKLLGTLEVSSIDGEFDGAPVRRLKPLMLLAYLAAARPRGFHRRDKLAAIFWPELSSERARAALRTSLSRLRDELTGDVIVLRGTDEIATNPDCLWCDVAAFDDAVAAGRVDDAVALYRGALLDGVHTDGTGAELEDWIDAERARLLRDAVHAAASLSTTAESHGDIGGALRAAECAYALSPTDEALARRTISLLVASGDHGHAMRLYDELVRRLHRDLDVAVSAETKALIEPLRHRAATGPIRRRDFAPQRAQLDAEKFEPPATLPPAPPRRASKIARWLIAASAIAAAAVALRMLLPGTPRIAPAAKQVVEWTSVRYDTLGPTARFGGQAVLDSTGNALILLGGQTDPRKHTFAPLGGEVWRLSGLRAGQSSIWTRVATAPGPHPSDRWLFGASYDTPHDRVVMHGGGLGSTSPCANDTWILDHASGIGHAPAWRPVSLRGAAPPARGGFDQVFDAAHRRLIVFAGHDCVYPRFDDTWVLAFDDETLSSGEWHALAADSSAGIPRDRDLYAAAYDTASGRMFVFGGRVSTLPTSELWALEHANGLGGRAAWKRVECAGQAPARIQAAGTFDAQHDVWTLFGGADANTNVTRDVWLLRGLARDLNRCRWEQAAVSGKLPAERYAANAMLLPESRGIVVYGGSFDLTPLGDTWVMKTLRDR